MAARTEGGAGAADRDAGPDTAIAARSGGLLRSRRLWVGAAVALSWGLLSGVRLQREYQHRINASANQVFVGSTYDPRGFESLESAARQRESRAFQERLRSGRGVSFAWPGLESVQVSWTWLELLEGMHHPSSYEGDFSWMFSKLDTVIQHSPKSEVRLVTGLASYFFVIGHDWLGANILLNELLRRAPGEFNTWFWGGFHAADNLRDRKLAADLIRHAAEFPRAPAYLSALALRLEYGADFIEQKNKSEFLSKTLEPAVLERVRRARPDWF